MKKYLVVCLFCSLFFSTGFLGFFESKEEKAIKNLINVYYTTPVGSLNNIPLNNYPVDIQRSFKELISAQSKLSKCSGAFSTAIDIFHIFYSAFAEGEPVDTLLSEQCKEEASNNMRIAWNTFKSICSKYGVKESYFNEIAKRNRH